MKRAEKLVLAIDVGGTNVQAAVVTSSHAILGRAHGATAPARGHEAILDVIAEVSSQACRAAHVDWSEVGAVGVAAAGAMDQDRGMVLDAPNMGWRDYPLRANLQRRLSRHVVIENDVNGAAWGEHLADPEKRDLVAIWLGTGVGGGIVSGGSLLRGARWTGGEIGQTIIFPDEAPGARMLEDHASRSGLARRIVQRASERSLSSLTADQIRAHEGVLTTELLAQAVMSGDQVALECLDRAALAIAVAAANAVTMLSVPRVVLGGGITEALGDWMLPRLRAPFASAVFPPQFADTPIELTRLRSDAGLVGAALLALGD